jgi:hypothetical protein
LPTPEELEVAELFLRKAASDLAAARTLAAAPGQQDDVVGFHAQQAVEMEAVLDREAAIRIAGAVLSWAQALVGAARQPRPEGHTTGDAS